MGEDVTAWTRGSSQRIVGRNARRSQDSGWEGAELVIEGSVPVKCIVRL